LERLYHAEVTDSKLLFCAQITYLPTTISYSPLRLSIAGEEREILRRDLYDARFQVMDQGENLEQDNEAQDDDKYIDADTDLIPGTYEGGLKTWEGGIDLVEVLAEYDQKTKKLIERIRGKRVIEVSPKVDKGFTFV
jgi:protein-histidine N-methyltransferase